MKVFKILASVALVALFVVVFAGQVAKMNKPEETLRRFRATPIAPRVSLVAKVRKDATATVPPMCLVERQHYGSCGKSSCWKYVSSLVTTNGTLEVVSTSSPVPAQLDISWAWSAKPELDYVVASPDRVTYWQTRAKNVANVNFQNLGGDRLIEKCIADGDSIYAVGCVTGNRIDACPNESTWGLVLGDSPRRAILEATNEMAGVLAGVLGGLFIIPLMWVPKKGPLVEGLAERTGAALTMKWSYLVLAILPVGLFFNFLFQAKFGGYVFFATVVVGWILLSANLLLRKRRVGQALAPVLATERSPIGSAQGTAELVVKVKTEAQGVNPILGPAPVAYMCTRVNEIVQSGKSQSVMLRNLLVPNKKLHVYDESGEGVLDLGNVILDVPTKSVRFTVVPPRLADHGVRLTPTDRRHIAWRVEEQVLQEGDTIYVFGDVTHIDLHADGSSGYRSVAGSPTLGGEGHPPLLVFKGDERGLVEALGREARADYILAVAASCVAGFAGALGAFLLVQ